ncbi:MAG: DUF4350 family protein of unknown function [uncultured archaeon A07HB70]|nr:MAG: DUF4350 family protein of unknown function [uncultured archaeon A07HB70]
MSDGLGAGGWAKRVGTLVLTVVVVVGIAAGGAFVSDQTSDDDPDRGVSMAEFQPENVTVDRAAAEGEITPDRSVVSEGGTVVIDDSHSNRWDRETIEPLVRGLTRVGYEVEVHQSGDLAAALDDAKALVVIDPGQELPSGDVDDIRRFTGQGGHLMVAGEPNRVGISASLFGTSLTTRESSLTTLGAAYGASVDTAYLRNQETADVNYKWIQTRSTDAEGMADVEQTSMYTAAAVRVRGGEPLLRAAPETRPSDSDDTTDTYPVAVRKNNAVWLGDKTFMRGDRYRVADNEVFLTYLVEFLASSDRDTSQSLDGDSDDDGSGGSQNQTVGGTEPVDSNY